MLLSMAALAVSARAQETVGGLVCGQTYDYDYIISVLGEPDYVSHDMYEFLVYKEKRLSAETLPVVPPTGTAQEAPKEDLLRKTHLVLLRELMDGVILLTISVQTGIPFRILHCPA